MTEESNKQHADEKSQVVTAIIAEKDARERKENEGHRFSLQFNPKDKPSIKSRILSKQNSFLHY